MKCQSCPLLNNPEDCIGGWACGLAEKGDEISLRHILFRSGVTPPPVEIPTSQIQPAEESATAIEIPPSTGCGCQKPKYPSIVEMGKNYVKSTINHALDGFESASPELIEERLSICHQCSFYDSVKDACFKCGCYITAKTSRQSEKCPINRW